MTEFPRSILSLGQEDDPEYIIDVIAEISATQDILNPKKPDDEPIDIHERGKEEQGNYVVTQRIIRDTEEQADELAKKALADAQGELTKLGDEDAAIKIIGVRAYKRLKQIAHDQEQQRNSG